MANKVAGVLLISLALTGCATQAASTVSRIEPSQPAFAYEKQIEKSQGEVWDRLVKNMAKSFLLSTISTKNHELSI